ncbi:MAG: hypothetical protein ABI360_04010 [Allobranchiibius sp.]
MTGTRAPIEASPAAASELGEARDVLELGLELLDWTGPLEDREGAGLLDGGLEEDAPDEAEDGALTCPSHAAIETITIDMLTAPKMAWVRR